MIIFIGSGSAGTMITHCIAVAAHLTEPIVVINSKELTNYQEEPIPITLYPAPQLDEIIFDIFKEEKIKYSEILNIPVLLKQKHWHHLLWKPPKL